MVILMTVSSLSSILLLITNYKKRNAYILTFLHQVTQFCVSMNTFISSVQEISATIQVLYLPQYQNIANALLTDYHARAYHQILIRNAVFKLKMYDIKEAHLTQHIALKWDLRPEVIHRLQLFQHNKKDYLLSISS